MALGADELPDFAGLAWVKGAVGLNARSKEDNNAAANRLRPDPAQYWAGSGATAIVAALIAVVGILISRWTLSIPIMRRPGRARGATPTPPSTRCCRRRSRSSRPGCFTCSLSARRSPTRSSPGSWGWPRWPRSSTRSAPRRRPTRSRHRARRPDPRDRDHLAAHDGRRPGDPPRAASAGLRRRRRLWPAWSGLRARPAREPADAADRRAARPRVPALAGRLAGPSACVRRRLLLGRAGQVILAVARRLPG